MNINQGLTKQNNQPVHKQPTPIDTIRGLLAQPNIKDKFQNMLGKKSAGFMASIINVYSSSSLINTDPLSVIAAASMAATLDLPINSNLGFAYIVPYKDKNKGRVAQFQMGYKGFIQLAIRSGQYKTINATEVYDGEIKHVNRLTGEIEFNDDDSSINKDKIIGYLAYFRLINGFEKTLYMTADEMEQHAKKYSQTYKSSKDYIVQSSKWTTDFDSMALKTVIKLILSKWGILSIEMQTAITADQAVIKDGVLKGEDINENVEYVDNPESNGAVDVVFKEDNSKDNAKNNSKDNEYAGTPFDTNAE